MAEGPPPGIDVHKRMLAVAVADVATEGEYAFERYQIGTTPAQLRWLAEWLVDRQVVLGGTALAQPGNTALSTWKQNMAKSKYDPGPAPKSVTRTYEPF
jgi:hypothetical protein